MRWRPAPKLAVYLALVIAGIAAGFAARRAEPVVLVAPLALALAAGLVRLDPLELLVHTELSNDAVTEGDDVTLTVELTTTGGVPSLAVVVALPDGVRTLGDPPAWHIRLRPGERRRLVLPVRCERWGAYDLGDVSLHANSRLQLLCADGRSVPRRRLRVYPRPEALRRLVRTAHPQAAAGNQLVRLRGSGIEYADMRPFVAGDQVREINWRASARRGVVWVNERQPERSTDVVLFLDTFGGPTLASAVRVANSLTMAYLAARDRVGLVSFGGTVRWLRPGMGMRHQYLIVDALLSTRVFPSVAWKDIRFLPPRVLPPNALVVAVTPLEDERVLSAVTDLRSRGIDVVVVEVSPLPYAARATDATELLARRLWRIDRERMRDGYRALGIPVVEWTDDATLSASLEELTAWPRGSRRAG